MRSTRMGFSIPESWGSDLPVEMASSGVAAFATNAKDVATREPSWEPTAMDSCGQAWTPMDMA